MSEIKIDSLSRNAGKDGKGYPFLKYTEMKDMNSKQCNCHLVSF